MEFWGVCFLPKYMMADRNSSSCVLMLCGVELPVEIKIPGDITRSTFLTFNGTELSSKSPGSGQMVTTVDFENP